MNSPIRGRLFFFSFYLKMLLRECTSSWPFLLFYTLKMSSIIFIFMTNRIYTIDFKSMLIVFLSSWVCL